MKKLTKLAIKKVTLRDLDEPALDSMAGGYNLTHTCSQNPIYTCQGTVCVGTCNCLPPGY